MSSHLHAVENDQAQAASGLPNFEGEAVEIARLKVTNAADLEGPYTGLHIDETVRLYVEGRVTRVDHVLDHKSGRLKRVHTIQISEALSVPWDFDSGVFDG